MEAMIADSQFFKSKSEKSFQKRQDHHENKKISEVTKQRRGSTTLSRSKNDERKDKIAQKNTKISELVLGSSMKDRKSLRSQAKSQCTGRVQIQTRQQSPVREFKIGVTQVDEPRFDYEVGLVAD